MLYRCLWPIGDGDSNLYGRNNDFPTNCFPLVNVNINKSYHFLISTGIFSTRVLWSVWTPFYGIDYFYNRLQFFLAWNLLRRSPTILIVLIFKLNFENRRLVLRVKSRLLTKTNRVNSDRHNISYNSIRNRRKNDRCKDRSRKRVPGRIKWYNTVARDPDRVWRHSAGVSLSNWAIFFLFFAASFFSPSFYFHYF